MKIYDLPVMQGREKSFYGKARIIEKDNGEKVLQSYKTEVCKITSGGLFVRLWNGLPVERPHRTGENPVYIYDAAGKIIGHKIGNGKAV